VAINRLLQRGRIVKVNIPDSQGRTTHPHPAVVLTSAEDITAGFPIVVAGISTKLHLSEPKNRVMLPWNPRRGGDYLTNLDKRCAAVCNWIVTINESDILAYYGMTPSYAIADIEKKARAAGQTVPAPSLPQTPPATPPSARPTI